MNKISSMRITIPSAARDEIQRDQLINSIIGSKNQTIYIQAGAGYGKTTLLSQLTHSYKYTVWLTLAGESDIFTFINSLCEAFKQTFSEFDFTYMEFFHLVDQNDFINNIADAFINSIEILKKSILVILDDLHTISDPKIKDFIVYLIKFAPHNINLCLSSREAFWKELLPVYVRGNLYVLEQKDLAFTREETSALLGTDDEDIYQSTEGWPLALGSYKILLKDGVSVKDIRTKSRNTLYSYLFYECISRLPEELSEFLKLSSCFEELDPEMLNTILNRNNSKQLLDNIVERNLFIIKTDTGLFRYHALFKKCLMEAVNTKQRFLLQEKAAQYYIEIKSYHKAAEYALLTNNTGLLQSIILASYQNYIRCGYFSELKLWFEALGDKLPEDNADLLVAKGAFLSIVGKFTEANICLDAALPLLNKKNKDLYIEAMLHKARVYRNCISFEESDLLLVKLAQLVDNPASEIGYAINVERLYNDCWNSKINDALALVQKSIEACARSGNLKIRAWYERYLSAIHFFAGNMKKSVYYYEKSQTLPENEQLYLDMHGIGIYAAKAYQMLGNNERALSLLEEELQKLKSTGKFEEMWSGYLFAAEIYYQISFINKRNGKNASFDTTKKYFLLADEYAPLYRKTDFQMQWTKMQRLTYSLIFTNEPKAKIISEIKLNEVGPYLKCIILARLMGYFATVGDYTNADKCALYCIKTGEASNMLLHSTLAYGILARAELAAGNTKDLKEHIRKYLRLCFELGIYEYFEMHQDYDPLLAFAAKNHIEPELVNFFQSFAGYKIKKAYIKTFGGFAVFRSDSRDTPLKMRTRKERELFAYLLDAGEQGATKEQIYEAIWAESDSDNIKKLIGVNLSQINKDFASLNIKRIIKCNERHYSINMDDIECDFELYEASAARYKESPSPEEAQKLLSLYTGEYLSDFEALWATGKRLKYRTIYEDVLKNSL